MSNFIKHALSLTESERDLNTVKLFRIALYGWFILGSLLLMPYAEAIWSPDAYITTAKESVYDRLGLFSIILDPAISKYQILWFYAHLILAILGFVGFFPRVTLFVFWLVTENLYTKGWVILDGGNNLTSLLLIYMLMLNTSGTPSRISFAPLRPIFIALHNLALTMTRCQIVIVYAAAGILKADGGLWQNGMALYYILQSKAYSFPYLIDFIKANAWVSTIGSYFTILFQLSFVFLVWDKRFKIALFAAGSFLHLGIALGMGLFLFGLIMMVSYISFFEDKWSATILSAMNELKSKRFRLPLLAER